jgi:hypothetical protein
MNNWELTKKYVRDKLSEVFSYFYTLKNVFPLGLRKYDTLVLILNIFHYNFATRKEIWSVIATNN